MFSFLKNHPFAVEAFFESSIVFTFAVPQEEIKHFIPDCFELHTFQNKWAFIAVAMVNAKNLRPKGFPEFTGNDFFLIGYRVFVRFTTNARKNLRGLYILKSETNKNKMEFLGNIFTHYNYTTTDILQTVQGNNIEITSNKSNFKIQIETLGAEEAILPNDSPFNEWKEARRFAGPLPFTFSYNKIENKVLIIEGVREKWKPMPVKVIDYKFSFLDNMNLSELTLASAFIIKKIPYYWKKGKIEKWIK